MRARALYALLIIVAAIVALAIAVLHLRAPRGPVIYAELHSAPGLREGAAVSFRGIAVGRVSHIGFIPGGLRVTITLDRDDVPLLRDDSVRVRPNGVLGDIALEIVPGPGGADAAAPGVVLHEASPDAAMMRRQAVGEALLRRMAHDVAPNGAADSLTKAPPRP